MRVLADTNIFISYLLNPGRDGSVQALIQAAVDGQITLLLPQDLMDEITVTVASKPYLVQRITQQALDALLETLALLGEEIPRITSPLPHLSRDQKDDYLIAYAVVGGADFLVTGDKDLLVLGKVGDLSITTANEFMSTFL